MDPRFTGVSTSGCVTKNSTTTKQVDGRYHWGYYDHSFWDSGDVQGTTEPPYPSDFVGYTDALLARGIGKDGYFPLEKMQLDYTSKNIALTLPPSRLSSHAEQNAIRKEKRQKVSGYNAWSGGKANSSGGTGKWRNEYHAVYNQPFYDTNGCDVYGNQRMNVSDVIAYLNLVCKNGLNYKPQTGYAQTDENVDKRNYAGDKQQGKSGQKPAY